MDRISSLEQEISEIRKSLNEKEAELYALKKQLSSAQSIGENVPEDYALANNSRVQIDKLPRWAIERYSRQILLTDIGVAGQEKLCAAKVLIVGAGGLGCPAAMYLAGAGIGEIGIVDYDTVDLTNIHRQVLHGESDQNLNKVDSAANALRNINSRITITPYNVLLDSSNAANIVSKYDIVLDCTDNVPTRYLLNDVCVITKLPLISGSALQMEGQITIYGYRDRNPNEKEAYAGPCYRCVFPSPPPPHAVRSCSAHGVAGPVPALVGALQALETIKYIVGQTRDKLLVGRMLLFDGEDSTFRTVKLRGQNPECAACSANPTITKLIDYEQFCKTQAKEKKKLEAKIKAKHRKEEKDRRMSGQSYLGVRILEHNGKRKWVRDVPKSERKIGPPCTSSLCSNSTIRQCKEFTNNHRLEIFKHFWNMDWKAKKKYLRSLIDVVPPKRRRSKHKGDISRKGDTRLYHLFLEEKRVPVCQVMFLNTLAVKEAMVRLWLFKQDKPKNHRKPIKALNVDTYLDDLPKMPPKCNLCQNTSLQYINLVEIKNAFQLYLQYEKDMKAKGVVPSSRKTFMQVFNGRNLRIYKPKNPHDICDIFNQHNIYLPVDIEIDRNCDQVTGDILNLGNLYVQW